jgi:hypothetical protein
MKKTKKKKKPAAPELPLVDPDTVTLRKVVRGALIIIAGLYLVTLWLDTVSSSRIARYLPRTWVYFAQIAALFPDAKPMTFEYRAEAWSCSEKKWQELDVRPYFPLDADNKENRFYRAMQFHRKHRSVMNALDDYLVRRWNADGAHSSIGGVRFLSLRVPIPKPGTHIEPYRYEPLASFPAEQRHNWYWTKKSHRAERCGYTLPPKDDEADDDSHTGVGPGAGKEPEP